MSLQYINTTSDNVYSNPSEELDKNIKHNFRITNLDKIDLDELREGTPVIGCGILTILLFCFFLFFSYFSFTKLIFPEYEVYTKSTDLLNNTLVSIESDKSNVLKLYDIDNNLIKTIPTTDNKKYLTNSFVTIKKPFGFWKILFAFLAVIYLIMAIYNVVNFYTDKNRKYR